MAAVNKGRRSTDQVEAPSESLSRRDAAERQNRVLLHAWQTAHPVLHEGQPRHIHTLLFQKPGGNPEVVVYLVGNSEPVAPEGLTPCPHHRNTQRDSPAAEDAAAQAETLNEEMENA
jgi:hypothetical protein